VCFFIQAQIVSVPVTSHPEEPYFAEHLCDSSPFTPWAQTVKRQKGRGRTILTRATDGHRGQVQGVMGSGHKVKLAHQWNQ
jgi:hypothetical protein